jgi:hypothetical protein
MDGVSWDFGLTVPPGWYLYDPDPDTRLDSTLKAVDSRIEAVPEVAPARQALVDVVLGLWRDADDQGALAAAVLWEPAPRAAVAASLTVLAFSDGPGTIEALLAGASAATGLDVGPREAAPVELPAGAAVRVRCLRRSGPDDDLLVDVVEHWVPVPGHRDVLLLRGSTPCLDLGDELAAVFDRVAGTLGFTSVPAQAGGDQ